jgi:PPOX class probable F420-dependent enzyme
MAELKEAVITLLEGANYAHLATIMPGGSPHSVPVWVGMERGHLAIQTSPGSRKARNIAHNPRVALSVTLRAQPFTMASIRGRVVARLEGDEAWSIIDRLSVKYTGSPYPQRSDRVVFLIEAEHAISTTY